MTDLILYELAGAGDIRFSPYCWRSRFALAHKGLEAEFVPCRYTEKERIAFSGQEKLPVLVDGETVVSDSWEIACYLEDTYPDRPLLFPESMDRERTRALNEWADKRLNATLIRLVIGDVFAHVDPADRDYFRRTREERFGAAIEEMEVERDKYLPVLNAVLDPLRSSLREHPFLSGEAPAYADFIVAGSLQWVRQLGARALIADDDPIAEWRERMWELFGRMGRE